MAGSINMEGKSVGLGTVAQFWLADVSSSGNAYVWYIDKVKGESKSAMTSQTYYYSIRYVKSD